MKEIFAKLVVKEDLSAEEMTAVAEKLFSGQLSDAETAAFLLGLTAKGESFDEIASLIKVIRSHAKKVPGNFHDLMDNCGTGGDRSFSFNISTTTSFLLAAGGIKLAKHGNRSISSKSGSADVLEELGIKLDVSPEVIEKALDEAGLAFLFAQSMHPVMRYVGPARQTLGIPTIMNIIGPLNHLWTWIISSWVCIERICRRLVPSFLITLGASVRSSSQVQIIWTKLRSMVSITIRY